MADSDPRRDVTRNEEQRLERTRRGPARGRRAEQLEDAERHRDTQRSLYEQDREPDGEGV